MGGGSGEGLNFSSGGDERTTEEGRFQLLHGHAHVVLVLVGS
jgi:hypothetical protein